ncbi:MAG: CdaR family protein [Kiritimatiellae bacterium]|nr:CdaR family protein [Kiritimatiellia bacterium]
MTDGATLAADLRERRTRRWTMVLSVVLATIVWATVREAISFETVVRDVPIRVVTAQGITVLEQSADMADVWFRGAQSDLAQLERQSVLIEVPAPPGVPPDEHGRQVVELRPRHVRSSGGARPVRIEPGRIAFSVDREGERMVPVRAEFQDAPPQGYEIGAVTCTPAAVRLRGPLSRLEEIEWLRTSPIDLQGRLTSFRVRAAVVPPAGVPSARLEPDRVNVEVLIVEHAAQRVLDAVPIQALMPPGRGCRLEVRPATVRVTLQGPAALLERMSEDEVRAFVEPSSVQPDRPVETRIRVFPPPGARVLALDPPSAMVELKP